MLASERISLSGFCVGFGFVPVSTIALQHRPRFSRSALPSVHSSRLNRTQVALLQREQALPLPEKACLALREVASLHLENVLHEVRNGRLISRLLRRWVPRMVRVRFAEQQARIERITPPTRTLVVNWGREERLDRAFLFLLVSLLHRLCLLLRHIHIHLHIHAFQLGVLPLPHAPPTPRRELVAHADERLDLVAAAWHAHDTPIFALRIEQKPVLYVLAVPLAE